MIGLADQMQAGKVVLPSGTWDWSLRPTRTGSKLTYAHRERPRDEMRTWTAETSVTNERAVQLALEPVERTWVDVDGLVWSVRIELPFNYGKSELPEAERIARVAFASGSVFRSAEVSADVQLGALTHMDLVRLLNG